MADKARDYKFALLSDLDRFDLDPASTAMEQLGRDTRDLADDADRSARELDDAFDRIARSTRTASRKVDDDTDSLRRNFRDVGDEASGSAREMASSFSGGADDVFDAFQEIAGQAGEAFGPIGVAAGVAMAVGIGLLRAEAEKLKQLASDMVEDMIDAGGRLSEEVISARIKTMAADDPAGFVKYNEQARKLGVSIRDVARARAGDAAAIERVRDRLEEIRAKEQAAAAAAKNQVAQRNSATTALGGLMSELGLVTDAAQIAEDAVATTYAATSTSVEQSGATARTAWDDTRAALADPIRASVEVKMPSRQKYVQIRQGLLAGLGTLVVPVKPGQSRFENNANNSRYRG